MTRIIRWDPMREMVSMRDAVDSLFDDFFNRSPITREGYGGIDVDMFQTDEEVIVKASIPGVKPEDINISVTNDVLTIRGEMKEEKEIEESKYQIRERRIGSFSRSMALPSQVKSEKAQAEFENGVLTLTLPKSEEVKPKMITVKAK